MAFFSAIKHTHIHTKKQQKKKKKKNNNRNNSNWRHNEKNIIYKTYMTEALPAVWEVEGGRGARGGGSCCLVPLEKMALFPKNKILIFYVPCSPKLPVLPCSSYFKAFVPRSPEKIALVPLFPKTPWRASCLC